MKIRYLITDFHDIVSSLLILDDNEKILILIWCYSVARVSCLPVSSQPGNKFLRRNSRDG